MELIVLLHDVAVEFEDVYLIVSSIDRCPQLSFAMEWICKIQSWSSNENDDQSKEVSLVLHLMTAHANRLDLLQATPICYRLYK